MLKIRLEWFLILAVCLPSFGKEACLYCHTDSSVTTMYDNSSHGRKNVGCEDCHFDKYANGFEALWKELLYSLTFSYKNAHRAGRPTTRTCTSCHNAMDKFNNLAEAALPEKLKSIGLVVAHSKHSALRDSCRICHTAGKFKNNAILKKVSFDDPMGCVACHQGVVHVKPEKYDTPFPLEKTCANCHSSSNKCPSMKKISDITDKSRCTECHPNQYSF